jgi:hypothetical protein
MAGIERPGPIKVTPENITGKWYSNLLGNPNHQQFIISSRKGPEDEKLYVIFLSLRRTGLTLRGPVIQLKVPFERPLYGESYLEQLNKRLVKSIFKYKPR